MHIIEQSEKYDSTTLINLHSNSYSQELHYYPFVVSLDRCVGSALHSITYLIKYLFETKQKI